MTDTIASGATAEDIASSIAAAINNSVSGAYFAVCDEAQVEVYSRDLSRNTNIELANFNNSTGCTLSDPIQVDNVTGTTINTPEGCIYFIDNTAAFADEVGLEEQIAVLIGESNTHTASNIAAAIGTGSYEADDLNAAVTDNVVTLTQGVADEDNGVSLSKAGDTNEAISLVSNSTSAENATLEMIFSETMDTSTFDEAGEASRITVACGEVTMGTNPAMAWSTTTNTDDTVTIDLDGDTTINAACHNVTSVNPVLHSANGESVFMPE